MIKGSKGGGSTGQETPNDLQNNSIYKVIDLISEGEIESFDSINFDQTPFLNDDGVENFDGVDITKRYGLIDQEYVSGFPSTSKFNNVGTEITKAGGGVIKIITDENVDDVNLVLAVPALSVTDSDQNTDRTTAVMSIEIMPDGGTWTSLDNVIFSGKTNSTYQKMYTIRNIYKYGSAPWSIKVTRVTDDAPDTGYPRYANKTYWAAYSEIIDGKLTYPNSAYIATSVDASKFGDSIPVRTFDIKGIKIKIPSNYNTETREYIGIWDGTFNTTATWTDNPAWILYDFLTNKRYGVGIEESRVDKYGLYSIGQYCDELVPDGNEGLEPRHTFSAVINSRASIYDIINLIAGGFHTMPYWSGSLIQFIQDKPISRPYNAVVAYSNIIGDFQYSGTSLRNRVTIVNVKWKNPENGYEEDFETVEDADGIQRYGYRTIDVTAYGCTSQGQAHRYGKWVLYTELNQMGTLSYTAGMDHIDLLPGDVIEVQDSHKSGAQFGGRLESIVGTTVLLDREVDLLPENSYTLTAVLPNKTIEDRGISVPYGKYTEIEIESPFTETPMIGSMWAISGTDVATQLFKVIGIADSNEGKFLVSAAAYDDNKFRYMEDLPLLKKPPISRIPTGAISPPSEAVGEEVKGVNESGLLQVGAFISWKPSVDPRTMFYKIYMKKMLSNSDFVFVGETSGTTFEQKDVASGIYQFRIKAIAPTGDSVYATTDSFEVEGIIGLPPNVANLKGVSTTDGVQLTWDLLDDPIVSGYEIRQGSNGVGWDEAEVITQDFKGTYLFIPLSSISEQTFFIRAISVLKVYGNAESVNITVAKPDNVSDFEVTKQDDSLLFSWSSVIGSSVEYEIRAGSSWGTAEPVLRSSGTNASRLFPGDSTTTFWIKAVSGLGLYSDDAIYWNIDISLVQNRNIIISSDERETDFSENRVNCTVNTSGSHGELEPGKLGQGNYWCAYNFPISIGYLAEARTWLDARLLNSASNTTTWGDADYAWGSDQADASWTVIGDLDNVKLIKSIYTKSLEVPSGVISLPFQENNAPLIGTIYSDSFASNEYRDMRIGTGRYFDKAVSGELITSPIEPSNSYHFKYTVNIEKTANEIQDLSGLSDYDLCVTDFYRSTGVDYNSDRHGTIKLIKKSDTNNLFIYFYNRYSQTESGIYAPESWNNCRNFTIGFYRDGIDCTLYIYCHEINEVVEINDIEIALDQLTDYFRFSRSLDANFLLSNFEMRDTEITEAEMPAYVRGIEPIGYNKKQELRVGDYIYEEAIIDVEISAPSTTDQMALWKCNFFTDVVDISEAGTEDLTTTDWTKINLSKKFNKVVEVFGWQKTGSEQAVLKVRNLLPDSFECQLVKFANQTEVITGSIEYMARGW